MYSCQGGQLLKYSYNFFVEWEPLFLSKNFPYRSCGIVMRMLKTKKKIHLNWFDVFNCNSWRSVRKTWKARQNVIEHNDFLNTKTLLFVCLKHFSGKFLYGQLRGLKLKWHKITRNLQLKSEFKKLIVTSSTNCKSLSKSDV